MKMALKFLSECRVLFHQGFTHANSYLDIIMILFSLDTIDVTNLNRQFLFRSKDVGHSKAESAARFINERCPWMNVVPYHGKIQDKGSDFYKQFKVVISGLDNVEARR